MPRIFLPAVTTKNNALLEGNSEEQSAAFALEESNQDSTTTTRTTTDDEATLDMPNPACRQRPGRHRHRQQQYQHQYHQRRGIVDGQEGRSSSGGSGSSGSSNAGTKRGRVEDEEANNNNNNNDNRQNKRRPASNKPSGAQEAISVGSGNSEGDDRSPPLVEYNTVGRGSELRDVRRSAEQLPSHPPPTIEPAGPSSATTAAGYSRATVSTPQGSTDKIGATGTAETRDGDLITGSTTPATRQEPTEAQEDEGEEETYAVVFMTQSLGITLAAAATAASDDNSGCLVVCDKETSTTTTTSKANPSSRIRIGDRLVSVGGRSAIGLGVNRVERLTVRGSRPLEMVFRRQSSRAGGASTIATTIDGAMSPAAVGTIATTTTTPSTGKASTTRKLKQRPPLGGLEQPSRDCLLDIISGIATQEDSLLAESQQQPGWPRETVGGCHPSLSVQEDGASMRESGARASSAETAAPRGRIHPPSCLPFTPPRSPTAVGVLGTNPRDDYNTNDDHDHRQSAAPATAGASPSCSTSSSSTEADFASPDIGGATDVATPAPEGEPTARARGQAAAVAAAAARPTTPTTTRMASDQRPSVPTGGTHCAAHCNGSRGGDGNSVANPKDSNPPQRPTTNNPETTNNAAGAAVAAAPAPPPIPRNGTAIGSDHTIPTSNSNNLGRAKFLSPLPSAAAATPAASGIGKRPNPRAGSAAETPNRSEVTRILAKLGPKGVSELALYKNLTFHELVRVCRYTGRVDLSKRLPKATMAERLNSLCVEQGALASELEISIGREKRAGGAPQVERGAGGESGGGRGGASAKGRGGKEAGLTQGVSARPFYGGDRMSTPVGSPATAAAVAPALSRGCGGPITDVLLQEPASALRTTVLQTPSPLSGAGDRRGHPSRPASSSRRVQETDCDTRLPERAYSVGLPPPPLLQSRPAIGDGGYFPSPPMPQQQQQQQQHQGGTPLTPRQVSNRGCDDRRGGADDDDGLECWADWEFPEKSTCGGGGGGSTVRPGGRRGGTRRRRDGSAGSPSGGYGFGESGNNKINDNNGSNIDHHRGASDDDDEAAWWSREPDYRDWSPCSSPTAAASAPPTSRLLPGSKSTSTSLLQPSSRDESGGDGEEGGVGSGFVRRNPLLPSGSSAARAFPATIATASSSERQQQQAGRNPLSLLSERFSGAGSGFTALPKWILRSVRTIGTQTPRR